MIEARGLTKRYGRVLAVDALSFDVRPGIVTGFLGPNGSGKSTTIRIMLGLDAPDRAWCGSAGAATVSWAGRCARSACCWRRGRSTPAAVPGRTWPR
jgi:ABC-2 type transport system ATP-binding protein